MFQWSGCISSHALFVYSFSFFVFLSSFPLLFGVVLAIERAHIVKRRRQVFESFLTKLLIFYVCTIRTLISFSHVQQHKLRFWDRLVEHVIAPGLLVCRKLLVTYLTCGLRVVSLSFWVGD
uniref:Putative magnesium transporter n=1 Tax=Rhizophora mucronata TaxID=61149 RepID=A0A2P2KJ34_RHIMU